VDCSRAMYRSLAVLFLAVVTAIWGLAAGTAQAASQAECDQYLHGVLTAGRPPSSGEIQYLYIECGIDYYQIPGAHLG